MRPGSPNFIPWGLALLAATGCVAGEVGDGEQLVVKPRVPRPPINVDGGSPADAGSSDAGFEAPADGGVSFNPFPVATVGSRCDPANQGISRYIVLSAVDPSCPAHATIVANGGGAAPSAWARLPDGLVAPAQVTVMATVCLSTAGCESLPMTLSVTSFADGAPARGTWSIQLDGVLAAGVFDAAWCGYDEHLPGSGSALAAGVQVQELAAYQAVKIPLVRTGAPVGARNAPVIQGRPALIRVFPSLRADWTPREVLARLTLETSGSDPVVLEARGTPSANPREDNPSSTFNFDVPANVFGPTTRYSVGFYELGACSTPRGDTAGARFPDQGSTALDARSTNGPFEVVLVPIRYDADGSGRLPDVSQAQLDRYYRTIYGMFPVPELQITVRQPMGWNSAVSRNGGGWSALLQAVLSLRNSDRPSSNTYYYGIFASAQSFNAYCQNACVTGLGPVPSANDDLARGAIGVGFTGDSSTETAAHELGHALGREHAPCDVSDADRNYPYAGGSIGSWGFDILSRSLISPSNTADLMGYCEPAWISDYNYSAFFNRIALANLNAPVTAWEPREWKIAIQDESGLSWGNSVILESPPRAETVPMRFLDASGALLGQDVGHRYPLSHVSGALILVPSPPAGAAFVDIAGAGVLSL